MGGLGESAASASLQVLFEIVAKLLIEEIRLEYGLPKELTELEKDVRMIGAILQDNQDMELSEALKLWLAELRDVAYDAIDVLDEHNTEKLRRNLLSFSDTRDVFAIVNPKRIIYRHKISHKIKEVATRMDRASKRRHDFGLVIRPSGPSNGRLSDSHIESTSSLPPVVTVGREDDKQQVVRKLTSQNDQGPDSAVSVLAIHGACGIGKTTLAQMVYNDIAISTHFQLKLWVSMSHEFNLERLTRSIIESINHGLPFGGTSLHSLQMELDKWIKGRRYLLVLDDFWHENRHDWEKLKIPLYKGAVGSRILVTARSRLVVAMVDTLGPYHLRGLSEDECYSLVHQYASSRDNDASNDLYGISREILNKCRGIPMEAISLGNRLHWENDRDKWGEIIRREEDDDVRNNFMRAIRLTYSRLPLNLKPCFSYCSIIPKGARLNKEWLIQLWMAQGFIPPRDGWQVEDVGNDFFDSLERRSFFQKAWLNHNGDRHEYHISDEIHDVSRSISNEECYIFELGKVHNLTAKVRHMSFIITSVSSSIVQVPFHEIYGCKGLYTLLVIDGSFNDHPLEVPEDLANNLASLRTLDLSYCNVTSLPDSIGDLKHLRCLQLWNTTIKRLPNSVCHLYNLQTLGLRNCNHLEKLPKETKYLQKLRHLDLHLDDDLLRMNYNSLKSMPPKIGLLVDLRVLSRFVISENDHCGISELGNLDRLSGELLISNMNLVKNPEDAMKANLEKKQHIQKLGFIWTRNPLREWHPNNTRIEQIEEKVLENLKPNSSIKMLDIVGYGGVQFPYWLRSGYLSNLQTLCLSGWKKCINLPPLGYLPLLRDLCIKGMDCVQFVDCNFCGSNPIRFRSLKKLTFESMSNLENWFGHENCELPRLDELVLRGCENLQSLNHNLPYLTKLTIEGSHRFNGLIRYPSLKYLEIEASGDWIWASLPLLSSLVSLTLSQLPSETLPSRIPKELNSLRSLEISHCYNLLEMPDDWIPNGLTHLSIKHCQKLRRLPREIQSLRTLEDLEIQDCIRLEYLPELKNLKSLTRLEISGCHSIMFLPSEGFPSALHFLSISDCPLFSNQFKDVTSLDRPKIANIFSVWIDGKNMSSSNSHQGESSRS